MGITLFKHQEQGASILDERPRYGLLWGCGIGKTITVLAGIDAGRKRGQVLKTLVICPLSVIEDAWIGDAVHFTGLNVLKCHGRTKQWRRALLERRDDVEIWVTTFETFRTMAEDFYRCGVRRIVIDESTKIKNHEAKISKVTHQFVDSIDRSHILTGTPTPNGEIDLWSQVRAICPGLTGRQFYKWANRVCFPIRETIRVNREERSVIVSWRPRPGVWEAWLEEFTEYAWMMRTEEAVDLPKETDLIRRVKLGRAEREAYDLVEDELLLETADGGEVNVSSQGRMMKTRQLCGGFAYSTGEEYRDISGNLKRDRSTNVYGESKMTAVLDWFAELGSEKVVMWADFVEDLTLLDRRLNEAGIKSKRIDGRVSGGDKQAAINEFQDTASDLRVVICHPASAAHGITLTAARYAGFYSLTENPELYEQARKRIHRVGQERPVFYVHFLAEDTVDDGLLLSLKGKMTRSEATKSILAKRRAAKGL